MRRALVGAATAIALVASLAFAAPAQSAPRLPPIPAPCGGPMPCGGPDERAAEAVDWVRRLCPGNVCPRP